MEYLVDPELAGRLRELSPLEREQLEANIIADGRVLDPIIVWGKFILDGRNRYPIAVERSIPFDVVEIALPDRESAKLWVINHQLGKRNIDKFEQSMLRAEAARLKGDTEVVAEQAGVSRRTVQRDVEALAAKEKMPQDARELCESGRVINSKADWKRYGELTDEQRAAVDNKLRSGQNITMRQALPTESGNELSVEMISGINDCKQLTFQQKQGIATGRIYATEESIREYLALADAKRAIIREILDDPEIDDLGDALRTLGGVGQRPSGASAASATINTKIEKRINDLFRLIDELGNEYRDGSYKDNCVTALRHLQTTWLAWAERNR
jgi:hypothetical protein